MEAQRCHFRDQRPPHEVAAQLERDLMTLLPPVATPGGLVFEGAGKVQGMPCRFRLRLESAGTVSHHYSFAAEPMSSAKNGVNLASWFQFWTRDFKASPPPEPGTGASEKFQRLSEQALKAEATLVDVPAIQAEILRRMQHGAHFSTAHKEGGSNIRYRSGQYVRQDYGESDGREIYPTSAAFLSFLRKFYHWQVSQSTAPEPVPELVAWKLIFRLLRED